MSFAKYERLGYLTSSFRLFYLKDKRKLDFNAHYHDFDKIILFLSGKVHYVIEGQSYQLFPYDIVFVRRNNVHYLKVDDSILYERIVIYINPEFLQKESDNQDENNSLDFCFDYTSKHNSYVMHLDKLKMDKILSQLDKIKKHFMDKSFAYKTYTKLNFLEFMILLNRAIIAEDKHQPLSANNHVSYDENILSVIDYINKNLYNDLSVEKIATVFFVSKYYLMRRFKAKTGYSIHQYILNKRLMSAKDRLNQIDSLTQLCFDCGFKDYSSFSRSFKKVFGQTPREMKKATINIFKDDKEGVFHE